MERVHVIRPRRPGVAERARDFWLYRRLVSYFGRRFLEKRYARTWLGWAWLPLRPFLDILARSFVFGAVIGIPTGGVPYFLYFLVGTMAWDLFESTLYWSTRSIELNRRVLRRIYVPRLTILAGALVPALVNFGIYAAILVGTLVVYLASDGQLYLDVQDGGLLALAGMALLLASALSVGLWLSVLAAQARDVRFGLSYALGIGIYITPVVYPLETIPENIRFVALLNPITAPVELVKRGLLGVGEVPIEALASTVGFIVIVATLGFLFFERSEAAALDAL